MASIDRHATSLPMAVLETGSEFDKVFGFGILSWEGKPNYEIGNLTDSISDLAIPSA